MKSEATKSVFLAEVDQQPESLKTLVAFYGGPGRILLRQWNKMARKHRRVVFSGMGTSEFSGELARCALAREGIDATTEDAGELLHYSLPIRGLNVLISQSGESVETRRLALRLRANSPIVAITNNESSTLAKAAVLVLPMLAGAETAISTKTYVNTLALLHLMASELGGPACLHRSLANLDRFADKMLEVPIRALRVAATKLSHASALHFVSRGSAMVAAKQAALTFMEGTRLPSSALTGGGFRHGPFELADKGYAAVFLIPRGKTSKLLANAARATAAKGSTVVVIADHAVPLPSSCVLLRVPALGEALFAFAATTTLERLLYELAARRGISAGVFRYGSKITRCE